MDSINKASDEALFKLFWFYCAFLPILNKRLMTNKTRKTKNKIFAIPTAEPAIPVNPNKPAINAIIKIVKR